MITRKTEFCYTPLFCWCHQYQETFVVGNTDDYKFNEWVLEQKARSVIKRRLVHTFGCGEWQKTGPANQEMTTRDLKIQYDKRASTGSAPPAYEKP